MARASAFGQPLAFLLRYKRLLGVALFLAVLFAIFELSGLRDHFNLAFIRQLIGQHRIGGLVLFVLLFSLGNLVHIPGLVFLAGRSAIAMSGIKFRNYVLGTLVRLPLPIALYCIFFEVLASGLHVR